MTDPAAAAIPLSEFTKYYIDCPVAEEAFCTICVVAKKYKRHGDLNKHLKKCHQCIIAWQCVACYEQFDDIRSCKAHQKHLKHGPAYFTGLIQLAPPMLVNDLNDAAVVTDVSVNDLLGAPILDNANDSNIPIPQSQSVYGFDSAIISQASQTTTTNSQNTQTSYSSRYCPSVEQRNWMAKIINCQNIDEVSTVYQEWIDIICSSAGIIPTNSRPSRPARVRIPMTAARLQKLYRTNRKKAMHYLNASDQKRCSLPATEIHDYFASTLQDSPCMIGDNPHEISFQREVPTNDRQPLERPFPLAEINAKLKTANSSAPGEDCVTYMLLKKHDCNSYILHTLFNKCRSLQRILAIWKKSITILIYKKGADDDLSNWRPIALSCTTAKLYASCVA